MKAVGQFVTSALKDIRVTVTLTVGEGDLVADRIEAVGVRLDSGERIAWEGNGGQLQPGRTPGQAPGRQKRMAAVRQMRATSSGHVSAGTLRAELPLIFVLARDSLVLSRSCRRSQSAA